MRHPLGIKKWSSRKIVLYIILKLSLARDRTQTFQVRVRLHNHYTTKVLNWKQNVNNQDINSFLRLKKINIFSISEVLGRCSVTIQTDIAAYSIVFSYMRYECIL